MPDLPPKSAASAMVLRPNPRMVLHQRLAKPSILHKDIFASINPAHPAMVTFTLELRAGGRNLFGAAHWHALIGQKLPPEPAGREVHALDLERYRVRFNTRSADYAHDWARDFHHLHMLPLITGFQVPAAVRHRFKGESVLFHYWHVYDLPAFAPGFVNHWRAKPLRGSAVDPASDPDMADLL